MGPFYAYVQIIPTSTNVGYYYRNLMVFASREDADEWWRVVSRPSGPVPVGAFGRISPQYYTFNVPNQTDIIGYFNTLTFSADDKTVLNKMFFTLITNGNASVAQSTFPQQDITDYVSGKWYYIRSKAVPNRFWYCNLTNGACLACGVSTCKVVHVSTELRSRLFIMAPDIPGKGVLPPKDLIMINKDKIKIAPTNESILVVTDGNQLKVAISSIVPDFTFNDFKNKFAVASQKVGDSVVEYIYVANNGSGEVWELVD